MKLDIGVADYPWSAEIKGAHLKGRLPTKPVPLLVVPIKDMMEKRRRLQYVRGLPSMVAFDPEKKRVWFFPTPDGEYHFVVPGVKEEEPVPVEMVRVRSPVASVVDKLKGTLHVPHGAKAKG